MNRSHIFHWIWAASCAASLPFVSQTAAAHGAGNFFGGESHGFYRQEYHHDDSFRREFRHEDREHRFARENRFFHHHHALYCFDFVSFGFPVSWYPDEYATYGDESPNGYGYWEKLAVKVQTQLARRRYYRGPINGRIDDRARESIRAFQQARGLPATGMVDPNVLRALQLPVPHGPVRVS